MADVHTLDTLTVGDLTLTVAPASERATLEITVDRDGTLILRAPVGVTRERAEQFVETKRPWVYRKLAEKDALVGPPVVKQFVDGEGFAYLGRNHRLRIIPEGDRVRLDQGRFLMPAHLADRGTETMRRWYRQTGTPWLQRRATPWINRLGRDDVDIAVGDLGYRWGSARPDTNRINIHWATLQLPPSLIDYVIAHELAHLIEPTHSSAYWNQVERLMPDYETRRDALGAVGKNVWLGHM